jgi:uncharacterized protein (DUF2235 family)
VTLDRSLPARDEVDSQRAPVVDEAPVSPSGGNSVPRNLVICSDGTGNTFDQHVSNVSRLVRAMDLKRPENQLVFYDQGIGTNPRLVDDVKRFKHESESCSGLEILAPPAIRVFRRLATVAGLAVGYGLYANVQEMYRALARRFRPEHDLIFFFGFSRGAFTVRTLAGLLYRCGLPASGFAENEKTFSRCFSDAWAAYKPHCVDWARIDAFRRTYDVVDVEVHLLGIWDTVKSYGWLRPQSLPHLRHNPIVRHVRHALALNEQRSWFLPTSWGGIDSDAKNASTIRPDARYQKQQIEEIWFSGCHSDIGGGDKEGETAKIAFRWMMGAATRAGLILDPCSDSWIFKRDATDVRPEIHESYGPGWWVSDRLPRWELDNSTRPPGYPLKWQGHGARCAEAFRRNGKLYFHSTTGVVPRTGIEVVESLVPHLVTVPSQAHKITVEPS